MGLGFNFYLNIFEDTIFILVFLNILLFIVFGWLFQVLQYTVVTYYSPLVSVASVLYCFT